MRRFQNTGQPDWDWWGRVWPTPGATLRRLGLTAEDRVVEIGSGNGYFALPAARVAAPATVYAVDVDGGLLAELDALATKQAVDNIAVVEGDARALAELLPEPVDFALFANAFHGVADRGALVERVGGVLAADGRFAVVNWHNRPREETTVGGEPRGPPTDLRLSPAETKRAIEDGEEFQLVEAVDLPPYHYGLVFER
jgi:SAM-dependent methyltransferase